MRVLLVDDEQEFVSALAERLSLRDIQADWAINADQALKKVETCSYDLAVLDVKLPGTSGIKLKQKLQVICPEMKFIFLTGHGSDNDFMLGASEAGSEYYLVKPIKIEDLIDKMKTILQQNRNSDGP